MQPFQQRVIDEKSELDDRLEKLKTFIKGDVFDTLPTDERLRMEKQMLIMNDYSAVLGERIAAF